MILWVMRYREGVGEVDDGEIKGPPIPNATREKMIAEATVLRYLAAEYGIVTSHIENIVSEWHEGGIWNVTVVLVPRLRDDRQKARRKEE